MMKAPVTLTLLCGILATPALCRPRPNDSPAAAQRIRFPHGVTNRQVRGRRTETLLSPYYVVRAHAGQRLSIRVESLSALGVMEPLVWVTSPSGEESAEKSSIFEASVPKTGNYIIRIGCNSMASDKKTGPFLLKIWLRDKPRA